MAAPSRGRPSPAHTRNTFITSSPRWLMTLTAIRPVDPHESWPFGHDSCVSVSGRDSCVAGSRWCAETAPDAGSPYSGGFSGKMGSIFPARVYPRSDCGAAAPRSGPLQQVCDHAVVDGAALWVGGYDRWFCSGYVPPRLSRAFSSPSAAAIPLFRWPLFMWKHTHRPRALCRSRLRSFSRLRSHWGISCFAIRFASASHSSPARIVTPDRSVLLRPRYRAFR